jgi:hypothetical protein
MRQGFDGTVAWATDAKGGVRELSGDELANVRREATFNAQLKWKEMFEKLELAGKTAVGDREAWEIRVVMKQTGTPMTFYYDTVTGLPLRADMTRSTPQGEITIKTTFADYRESNGVKTPHEMTMESPIGKTTIRITSVTYNEKLDDNLFAKPLPN